MMSEQLVEASVSLAGCNSCWSVVFGEHSVVGDGYWMPSSEGLDRQLQNHLEKTTCLLPR